MLAWLPLLGLCNVAAGGLLTLSPVTSTSLLKADTVPAGPDLPDCLRRSTKGPLTFGVTVELKSTGLADGTWTEGPGGERRWSLGILSPGATSQTVLFKNVSLPGGSSILVRPGASDSPAQDVGVGGRGCSPLDGCFFFEADRIRCALAAKVCGVGGDS